MNCKVSGEKKITKKNKLGVGQLEFWSLFLVPLCMRRLYSGSNLLNSAVLVLAQLLLLVPLCLWHSLVDPVC